MKNIIFHIDVNSAYLSWTALELLAGGKATDLRDIPSIIGGDRERRHGIVLAKSVPAKKYGIYTSEPIVSALRKCPDLTIIPPNHKLYSARSRELMQFLTGLCPDVEQTSIDECYLYYSPVALNYESPLAAAELIRSSIRKQFGYTVNIGISDKKILSKMASNFKKPDLIHTLYSGEIREKMWPLPVSALHMCGKSSVSTLRKLDIHTIGDLAAANRDILYSHLKSHGLLLWEYANGIDDSKVLSEPSEVKGVGNSITLSEDALTQEESYKVLLVLAESVSSRLRDSGQLAGMISVEIKYHTFKKVSHQMTLQTPVNTTGTIYKSACRLFDELWDSSPIRLLGIRTSKLTADTEPVQLSFADYLDLGGGISNKKQAALDQALDRIRTKYGDDSIVRGSLFHAKDHYKKH